MEKEHNQEETLEKDEETTEETEEKESKEESTEDRTLDSQSKEDPLDSIDDVESLRNEAKKYRGIASRTAKKDEPEEKKDEPQGDFLSKEEFYKANEKKAIHAVTQVDDSDPLADVKRQIDENYDDIVKYYRPERGKQTPEDIMEDVFDAYYIWSRREGKDKVDDGTRSLQGIHVTKGSGTGAKTANTTEEDPRFSRGTDPKQWYKKTE